MKLRTMSVWMVVVVLLTLLGCDSTEMTSAKVYLQQKNYEKAEEQLLIAFQNEPMNSEPAYLLGLEIYARAKNWEKTAEYFQKSLAIDQRFATQIDQALNKYWVDNFNAGAQGYNALIKGEAKDEDKVFEMSVNSFQNCILLIPEKPESYGTLAQVYLFREEIENAKKYMAMAIDQNPEDLISLVNLGNLLFREKQYDEALEYLQRAMEVDPANLNAIKQIAFVYDAKGESDKAAEAYLKAIEADPENPDLHYNLGVLYYQQEKFQDASAEFIKVSELSENSVDALFNAGLALEKLEKFSDAEKYLEQALELDPNSTDIIHELKLIYYKLYGMNSKKFKDMDAREKALN